LPDRGRAWPGQRRLSCLRHRALTELVEDAGSNTESVAGGKDLPALFNSVVVLRAAVLLSKSACMVVLRIVGVSAF